MALLDPDPLWIALIFVKRFVFLELLLMLALLRTLTSRGPSRLVALLCVLLCAGAILTIFAPALNLTGQGWYGPAARALAQGQGLIVPLGVWSLFFLSALMPGCRVRVLDWLSVALVSGLLGLWIAAMI